MKLQRCIHLAVACVPFLFAAQGFSAPATGTRLSFRVLSTQAEVAPPIATVDFIYGPSEPTGRRSQGASSNGQWWQLEIRTNADASTLPQCIVRGLTSADPLAGRQKVQFSRYQLRLPGTGEALEYVDLHSGSALLPAWVDFEEHFVPTPAAASRRQGGAPETCLFLGHVLSLYHTGHDVVWTPWSDVKRLELDREVLVGTGRNFKDVEGRRLPQTPQPQNYTYTNFNAADYSTMIEAGMNVFTIAPEQEQWVRAEPAFYLRTAEGAPPLLYPADLYRANYLGPSMFMDEPACVLGWDKHAAGMLTHFSDAAALIEKRTQTTFESDGSHYGRYWLEKELRKLGINFGGMRLAQVELPVWETQYDTTFYEMKGGGTGIVHEGRYQLKEFDDMMARFSGEERRHTVRELLQWHYAFLRGGSRPFDKFWGTSIYGQCDPAIAPQAFAKAYDMGARYFWFWSSDHGHHVPWPEQLALTRTLKTHAREHPRLSLYTPRPKTDKLILLPDGYFAAYASPARLHCLDKEGKGAESLKYQRLQSRLASAVEECFRRGEDFDIAVDDGRRIKGYRRVVKLSEKE